MKKLISNIVLTLAFGAIAFSQGGGQGRGMTYDRTGAHFVLASRPDVQMDLKLTDDAKAAITKAAQDRRAAMRAARTDNAGDQAAMDKAVAKASDDFNLAVSQALDKLQNRRLFEIFVQIADGKALEDPDVQTRLEMTKEQKGKIEELTHQDRKANDAIREKVNAGQMDNAQATIERRKNELALNASLLLVLTTEQKPKFAEMAGSKFTPDPTINTGRRGGGN